MRWSRLLAIPGLTLSVLVLAACNGAGAGPTSPAAGSGAPGSSSAAASGSSGSTPAPTDMVQMNIALLPTPSFDTSRIAVACDQATLGSSASMSCDDLASLTARIATTMSNQPVQQIAVTAAPDNASAIQVTFWVASDTGSGLDAFTSVIDPANQTFTFPQADTEAVFPTAS